MLKQILASTGLDAHTSASLLGVNPQIFDEWVAGQRLIPDSMVHRLSTVLGVQPEVLLSRKPRANQADVTPAIWFKLRGNQLGAPDRECVFLVRQLGYFVGQLEEATGKKSVGWKPLFEAVRAGTGIEAPPREQGRQAARMFRESTGLGHGCKGIGEILRGKLRSMGLLVIESPLPESKLEGCSFYLGAVSADRDRDADRPCIFANTHHSTWFRRNLVLMHEVAHAIFDARNSGASLDFQDNTTAADYIEERAQAFAREVLVPKEVLRHVAQQHALKWESLQSRELATLVAKTHVEQKTVIESAIENELISPDAGEQYLEMNIGSDLREISEHALHTKEYVKKIGKDAFAESPSAGRTTSIPSRRLLLPIPYVRWVVDACKNFDISPGRASELLMIDEDTFNERFGRFVALPNEDEW